MGRVTTGGTETKLASELVSSGHLQGTPLTTQYTGWVELGAEGFAVEAWRRLWATARRLPGWEQSHASVLQSEQKDQKQDGVALSTGGVH